MNFQSLVVLYVIEKIRGERTASGILHILTGKKSSQTIQDCQWFGVSFLFQTASHLTNEKFIQILNDLHKECIIEQRKENSWVLTNKGYPMLQTFKANGPFPPSLHGGKYGEMGKIFWKRFSLFVQSLSYMVEQPRKPFYPVHRDRNIHAWVKKHFPKTVEDRLRWLKKLYEETYQILKSVSSDEAFYFTMRLSRMDRIGLTNGQAARLLGWDDDHARFIFQGILHFFVAQIVGSPKSFPNLYIFLRDMETTQPLTSSTAKTYNLLLQGKTIEEIKGTRRLKQSTIEDHLVELAIHVPDFSIAPYVTIDEKIAIREAIQSLHTYRLKQLKECLQSNISYFKIRLVIAKSGGELS